MIEMLQIGGGRRDEDDGGLAERGLNEHMFGRFRLYSLFHEAPLFFVLILRLEMYVVNESISGAHPHVIHYRTPLYTYNRLSGLETL